MIARGKTPGDQQNARNQAKNLENMSDQAFCAPVEPDKPDALRVCFILHFLVPKINTP